MTTELTHGPVLFVDDEENILRTIKRLFMDEPFDILTADSGLSGLDLLKRRPDVSVIVSDLRMPGMSGAEFLEKARDIVPDAVRIVLTGYADVTSAVDAINKGGAYRYIGKPWNDDEFKISVSNGLEQYRLLKQNEHLKLQLQKSNYELQELNDILRERITDEVFTLKTEVETLARTAAVFNLVPLAVAHIDGDGVITTYNQAMSKLFSWHAENRVYITKEKAFSAGINEFIDTVMMNGASSVCLRINGNPLHVHGERAVTWGYNAGVILVFNELMKDKSGSAS